MEPNTQLVHFDTARRELILASSIDEVKLIRDKAEALRLYVKQQGAGLEMQNQCAEIKIRAERRAGEMLREQEKNKGAATPLHDERALALPRLSDLGISEVQSHRWQSEAEVPEDVFEQHVATIKDKQEELTSSGLRRLAIKLRGGDIDVSPLPEGVFDVIYADPPWRYDNTGVDGAAQKHYQTMSIEQLCTLEIPAADNSVLFLWVTNPFLRDAFTVIDAWGFEYKTNIVWVKENLKKPGAGFYVRGRHELLFICTKGAFVPDMKGKEPIGSILFADVEEHSRKPSLVYGLIESIYPNCKYLELFARNKREGWESWGLEA